MEARQIKLTINNRIFIGYADINSSVQSEEWKNNTEKIYRLHHILYDIGFPCFRPGKMLELNGLRLYEEYSKGKTDKKYIISKEKYNFRLLRKFFEHLYFDFNKVKDYFYLDDYDKHWSLADDNSLNFDLCIYKNKLYLCDFSNVRILDNDDDWTQFIKNNGWPLLKRIDIFKILEDVKKKEEKNWKSLSLVESAKRKMVRLFQKDTSVTKEDLLKSAFTINSGEKKQK